MRQVAFIKEILIFDCL